MMMEKVTCEVALNLHLRGEGNHHLVMMMEKVTCEVAYRIFTCVVRGTIILSWWWKRSPARWPRNFTCVVRGTIILSWWWKRSPARWHWIFTCVVRGTIIVSWWWKRSPARWHRIFTCMVRGNHHHLHHPLHFTFVSWRAVLLVLQVIVLVGLFLEKQIRQHYIFRMVLFQRSWNSELNN